MAQVKFSYGLLANYNGLETKDPNTVYFITDKPFIYFNGKKYGVEMADIKAVKSISLGEDNKTLTISYVDGSQSTTISLAEATQSKAGLMSAADKVKLDNLSDALENNSKYNSAMDDGLATVDKLGGIPAGTTAGDLKKKTLSEVFDDLLFPTVDPTFIAPSASLSLKSTTTTPMVQEVGATGASVPTAASFNTSFNRGKINIAGVEKQKRAGELDTANSFIYINTATNKTFPTSIAEGATTYKYRAAYKQGPQPLNSKGGNYGDPLPAGHVDSAAVTITGVYPYFANSANNATVAKLALTTSNTLSALAFKAEGPNKHTFKLPAKYTLTNVTMLNTLSGKYEAFGTSKFTVTTESITVQGTAVDYKVYTRNDSGFSGEATFNITFTK